MKILELSEALKSTVQFSAPAAYCPQQMLKDNFSIKATFLRMVKTIGTLPTQQAPILRPAYRMFATGFIVANIIFIIPFFNDLYPITKGAPYGILMLHPMIVISFASIVLMFLCFFRAAFMMFPVHNALKDNDYRICGNCGQSLLHLAQRSQCPECGKQYDMVKLLLFWRKTLKQQFSDAASSHSARFRRRKLKRELFPFVLAVIIGILMWMTLGSIYWFGALFMNYMAADILLLQPFMDRRLIRRLNHCGFRRCIHCFHWLEASGDDEACSRCGKCESPERLREFWTLHAPPHWEEEMSNLTASADSPGGDVKQDRLAL